MIEQIMHEMYNHNLYRTFANYYKVNKLHKLEEYFEDRAHEELVHQKWLIDRLNQCDYPTTYIEVKAVEVDLSDPEGTPENMKYIKPFELTVEAEIETTALIENIATQAMEEKDWVTFGWLYELLLKEQHEGEYVSRHTWGLAKMDTDWQTKQDSIIEFYEDYDEPDQKRKDNIKL